MKNIVRQILNRIQQEKVNRRKMRMALLVLSAFVVTGVLWQLKLTGITMTAEALCGHLEHTHTEQCLEKALVCQEQESPGHSHSDAECYAPAESDEATLPTSEQVLICPLAESAGHSHGDSCYETKYICGYDAEHIHSVLCYSDTKADLETRSNWESTLPKLTGDPRSDLVAVAASQLGYTESLQNYKTAADGTTKLGYTRYGEWYGNPYGNWNTMFVSFCLKYAEHPAYSALTNSGADAMRLAADAAGYLRDAAYTPQAGDLIFLDKNGNASADAVAIVRSATETSILVLEGDLENAVRETSYAADSRAVMGYAMLTAESSTEATVLLSPELAASQAPASSESDLIRDNTVTVSFVIDRGEYTADPQSRYTHISVKSIEGLSTSGLTYTSWAGRYQVTGTGTLVSHTIPAGSTLRSSGYSLPPLSVEHIGNNNANSYASTFSWVNSDNMICNDDTVFTKDTVLYLSMYPAGECYTLNWVCNCSGTDIFAGSHSVRFHLSSLYPSATFAPGQSIAPNYIPSAEDVNRLYTGNGEICNVGSANNKTFVGWYLKNETTGEETDLTPGLPFRAEYIDPNSDGLTIKVYARWQAASAEQVTATFVSGQTVIATRALEKNGTLGALPAAPAAEVGKYFVGWQAEGEDTFVTEKTVISADTTYHAVYGDACRVTFLVNGNSYGETVYVVPDTALGPLPTPPVDNSQIFLGWSAEGIEGYVTQDTVISSDMVLTAQFDEPENFDVYFHDIDPDGNDRLTDGVSVSMLIPNGSSAADWLDGELLDEDTAFTSCIWYTLDDSSNRTPYDLSAPVTEELHLYTYSYKVTLTMEEATAAQANFFFVKASAAEILVDGDTLTLTLREGETPTITDFVVNGTDYSLYTWTESNGQEVQLDEILESGVTENITATSSEGSLSINATTDTQHIRFYAIVDGNAVLVSETDLTVYSFGTIDPQWRWRISEASLEAIYKEYGLDVTDKDQYKFAFCSGTNPDADIWNDVPLYEANGVQFIGLEPSIQNNICFYYLPKVSELTSTASYRNQWSDYSDSSSFYTVTVQDGHGLYEDEEIPDFGLILCGETAKITLPIPADRHSWHRNGEALTGTDNGDGTVTYTFANVTAPIVISSYLETPIVTVLDSDNAIYERGDELPCESASAGSDIRICVKHKEGYIWQANGVKLSDGILSDDQTTVTFTFQNVTEDIYLTPHVLTVLYDINLLGSPLSTVPTISSEPDTYQASNSGYILRTPTKTYYTIDGWNSMKTVLFLGWDADGNATTVEFSAGETITAAELERYADNDANVFLKAVWEDQGYKKSVSFYVNLNCAVIDYGGIERPTTDNNGYTDALYGTNLVISPEPVSYPNSEYHNGFNGNFVGADGGVVLEGTDTALIDARIREFAAGSITEKYGPATDYVDREFSMGIFPDDESMLMQIRKLQEIYIKNYLSWKPTGYDWNGDGTVDEQDYRLEDHKLITIDGHYIPVEQLTTSNYTIRWFVFKYSGSNGWHIDGTLVKKQGQLTVTKTFYGNETAIQAVKGSPYTISVISDGNQIGLLNLDPYDISGNINGYTDYDDSTDTYAWKLDLTANQQYTLKENNYSVAANIVPGMDMASLADYMVIKGEDVPRTTYSDSGVSVTAKAYSVDVDYTNFKTVRFFNSYIPTNAMLLRKVDDSGNILSDVRFRLEWNDTAVQMYQDDNGSYYIYDPVNSGISATPVDCITTDSLGQAVIIGLKDSQYAGEYKLAELSAPVGYAKIEEEMTFMLSENGQLSVEDSSSYISLMEDGTTLQITNTSHTMDVTATKVWSDNTVLPVKVALHLNGHAMSSDTYEVTLDSSNNWSYTWNDLPSYVGGKLASYTILETWIGGSAYSALIDDGYENYVVMYSDPVYTYSSSGDPTSLALTVTNRTDSGEVEFTKVDHKNVGLADAEFQLYADADCTIPYGGSAVSDTFGRVTFGSLAAGRYYMKEIRQPTGYQENPTTYEVKVTGSGTQIYVLGEESPIPAIANIPANANLRVRKTDDQGNPLKNAIFTLYQLNEAEEWDKVIIDGKNAFEVDENGIIDFTNLSGGQYKLVETAAPAGYYRLTEEIPFTVSLGKVSCINTRNNAYWTFADGTPATITVVNIPGSELPHTGGMGTHFSTMAGLLMMAGSLLYGFLPRRKRERGTD